MSFHVYRNFALPFTPSMTTLQKLSFSSFWSSILLTEGDFGSLWQTTALNDQFSDRCFHGPCITLMKRKRPVFNSTPPPLMATPTAYFDSLFEILFSRHIMLDIPNLPTKKPHGYLVKDKLISKSHSSLWFCEEIGNWSLGHEGSIAI